MDLDECYRKGLIKKTKINNELIKSLIKISNIKESAVNAVNLDDVNISAYVSLAYDALRELLESICISKGYKVLSHLCLGELLNTLIDDFDLHEFDRMRYMRNGVNYYGVAVEFKQGKMMIDKMFFMKNLLANKHLENIK